eukprot:GFUD01013854.1.p1 GENE.GFUD01013854.1~~GFUD01013854.1.p1  ORF type:complete len:1121 (+),score=326.05 GFUD01013854.1:259-3621(+)
MSGRTTPAPGSFSPHKNSRGSSTHAHVSKSPLSPFRYSEDSLRILPSDIQDNKITIPLILPASSPRQIRTVPTHSLPQTPRCHSRMTSLPSSPLIHSPLTRNLSSPVSIPFPPSYHSTLGVSHSHGGGSLGTPARTMRDYDESLRENKKENFNLKLRIFFLEERLALGKENSNENVVESNIDLKVQLESCKQELSEKLSLLVEASEALEHLDTQIKTENKRHEKEVKALKEKCQDFKEVFSSEANIQMENKSPIKHYKHVWQSPNNDLAFEYEDLKNSNEEYLSNETMVLEVMEELEEFSEREKDFETRYNKQIQELKCSSNKTEADLRKIQLKMSEYEEEIESLNSNLDAKNDFIEALQQNIEKERKESQFLEKQLEKSGEVIKEQEEGINTMKRTPQTQIKKNVRNSRLMKNKGINTETSNFTEIIKHLEDEILFKNQEINEFQLEIKIRDEKIVNFEKNIKLSQSNYEDSEMPQRADQDGSVKKFESLNSDNKKLNDQVKLHIHEQKHLLKKIKTLKDQLESNDHQMENCRDKIEVLQVDSVRKVADPKESRDAELQCDLDQSSVILESYKHNLSRYRKNTLVLKKKLADSIESLKEFRKSHDKFVHMVEVIVNMDDINTLDEINNLVNDTKKMSEIHFENEELQLEDLDFLDSISISSSSLSSDSQDNMRNFQTSILQYLEEERKEKNRKLSKNGSLNFTKEDELLMRDALTDSQNEIVNDLKNNFETVQEKKMLKKDQTYESKRSYADYDSWSDTEQVISLEHIGLPQSYLQKPSSPDQEETTSESDDDNDDFACLSNACLAEEKNFLVDLLDLLREEIDSCELVDSGVELDYDAHHTKKDGKSFHFCRKCSSCIQQDMNEVLRKLHYGLPDTLDQVKKLKYFYEVLCNNSRKAFSESERNKQTLAEYHVLIANLTSENLKMTGEKLASKSEIEEIQKRSTKIIQELENEIFSLNSQLADREVEALRTKTSPSPRTTHLEFLNGRTFREDNARESSSPPTSGSCECVQSPGIIKELSASCKQKSCYWSQVQPTKLTKSALPGARDAAHSEETSSSENEENGKGLGFCIDKITNKNNILQKNRDILDNKMVRNVPKKFQHRPIKKYSRTLRRCSDS